MALPALRQPKCMAKLPALRQPKCVAKLREEKLEPSKTAVFSLPDSSSFLILTLKNGKKLVVTSDAYNGIVKVAGPYERYECVFCADTIEMDSNAKELHKRSNKHHTAMNTTVFYEELAENLIKQISNERTYCTLCHVVLNSPFLTRHITTEAHCTELARAKERGLTYKPST